MKVALITGGSRGIGAETVKKFAKSHTVILNYNRSEQQATQLKEQLVALGYDVHLYRADVSDATQVCAMFDWLKNNFKRLDVLVNNAGVAKSALCQDFSEIDYDWIMDTNAKGAFLCCQQAIKLFLRQGSGAIVNVASIWGVQGASCETVYAMSKHAVVGLTKSLSEELSLSNVTVNCVCPPIVLTDMCKMSQEDIDAFCQEQGKKVYTPGQVAEDIYNLALGGKSAQILEE